VRQNLVETRLVRVGFHSDLGIEIREGLREGDLVVAVAGSSLRDGDKVTPVVGADSARIGQR
jgi:type II secretory pathway component PulC